MSCYRLNNPPVIAEKVDDEVIVINLDSGTYHSLRGNAATVWSGLVAGATREDILAGCDDDASLAEPVLDAFIGDLLLQGLIAPVETPGTDGGFGRWSVEGVGVETFDDMTDLLALDPVHEVDLERGWPIASDAR